MRKHLLPCIGFMLLLAGIWSARRCPDVSQIAAQPGYRRQ